MNILILGSGGREHALAWAISKSPKLSRLVCAPGNPGMALLGDCVAVDMTDNTEVIALCQREEIDFVIIGPEGPLTSGIVDALDDAGVKAFGPTAAAARLEGSKSFTKDLCRRCAIPTASYQCFSNLAKAIAYIETQNPPLVVKADGLAAGKGVTIATSRAEARHAVHDIFAARKEKDGVSVIIEDYLEGEEASLFILSDGTNIIPLAGAQDHKRAFDGDRGPNTGGMGAYSPAPILDTAMTQRAIDDIIMPTIEALSRDGTAFQGLLYAGLMINAQGPHLIEYNVRFGDPECQALVLRLEDDLLDLLLATTEKRLAGRTVRWSDGAALTVAMVSEGYPAQYTTGSRIKGLDEAGQIEDVIIFHAGTARRNGDLIATGGRVLNIAARGKTITEARERAYAAIQKIDWPQGFYRHDIGWRAIERERMEDQAQSASMTVSSPRREEFPE